jgi:hypothetical protein
MKGIINNGGMNTGRKGMKMRNKLKIVFLIFIITVAVLGCIESQKLPDSNETKIATTPEQKLPAYNETKPLRINDTFETWSRGYWSNFSYKQTYFRVISNYSEWTAFLDEQGYFKWVTGQGSPMLEGELFPGLNKMPKTITSNDFNDHFIIAAMMGYRGIIGPQIEIKNITKLNSLVNVTVHMYEPKIGPTMLSAPYHIVTVKEEILPIGNSTFVFTDTEGKLLGNVELNK